VTKFEKWKNALWLKQHQERDIALSLDRVHDFQTQLLSLLFPIRCEKSFRDQKEFNDSFDQLKLNLSSLLKLIKVHHYQEIVDHFFDQLPEIENQLTQDADFILQQDPATTSLPEIILSYPGFFAIANHRIAHILHQLKVPLLPRIISERCHSQTGIDIHPGAQIGCPFFIDHGTGVVIGETTNIGNYVKIFQGVTLGALSATKKLQFVKRHPTIEDHVIIYSNATILGGETTIGAKSVIGGNMWITKSVAANSKIYQAEERE
jgi:serine O-acetyltransferase